MAKIINFAKTEGNTIVVQPDFRIEGYNVMVTHYSGNDTFRIAVGCYSTVINKTVLKEMLRELKFEEPKKRKLTFIIGKTKTKPTITSPVFLEKSPSMYISTANKCYSMDTHQLIQAEVADKPKYFSKDKYDRIIISPGNNSRTARGTYLREIQHLLNVIKDYYYPAAEKPAQDAEKSTTDESKSEQA